MSKWKAFVPLAGIVVLGVLGCGRAGSPAASSSQTPDAKYRVASEPDHAVGVMDARASARDQDPLVMVGRIGGSGVPFVDGLAAFTIVDMQVPHCTAEEGCATPWDYCCEQNRVSQGIAMVKIVDAEGQPVATDARQLLGVKELSTVVVRGKAQRDADGNLVVLADQVYVRD